MTGKKALRFSDRYRVESIDYTDNSKGFVSNMKANYGVYKANLVDLKGDVVYVREDGFTFNTDAMLYNTKSKIVTTTTPYTSHKGKSYMKGKELMYNAKLKQMHSKTVEITYKLDEEK